MRRAFTAPLSMLVPVWCLSSCAFLNAYPPPEDESTAAACRDGADNDVDGLFDCEDPSCDSQCPEGDSLQTCADGRDQDGDGRVDAADPDCFAYVSTFEVERCGSVAGTELVGDFAGGAFGWAGEGGELVDDPTGRTTHTVLMFRDERGLVTYATPLTGSIVGTTLSAWMRQGPGDSWGLLLGGLSISFGSASRPYLSFAVPTVGISSPTRPFTDWVDTVDRWLRVEASVEADRITVRAEPQGLEPLVIEAPSTWAGADAATLVVRAEPVPGDPVGVLLDDVRVSRPRHDPCGYEVPQLVDRGRVDVPSVTSGPLDPTHLVAVASHGDEICVLAARRRPSEALRTYDYAGYLLFRSTDGGARFELVEEVTEGRFFGGALAWDEDWNGTGGYRGVLLRGDQLRPMDDPYTIHWAESERCGGFALSESGLDAASVGGTLPRPGMVRNLGERRSTARADPGRSSESRRRRDGSHPPRPLDDRRTGHVRVVRSSGADPSDRARRRRSGRRGPSADRGPTLRTFGSSGWHTHEEPLVPRPVSRDRRTSPARARHGSTRCRRARRGRSKRSCSTSARGRLRSPSSASASPPAARPPPSTAALRRRRWTLRELTYCGSRGPPARRMRSSTATAADTPSSARRRAPRRAARARSASSARARSIARAKRADVSRARGIGSGPTPSAATRAAQNGWSIVNGTTTLGTPARKAAPVVPAPP
ncbi:MAG: hypothetical protein M5U28_12015 [Sandaracinaceae bacterium]|nr:hypothetical protein [Sandaracinaceae bacterium]